MTLVQLNYIVAVDRCRNFAQAARECFVTQPTLSMQIQKLEDYLQIIIFDRSKNPVVPTPMGKKVLVYAQRILTGANDLEELSKSLRGEVSGEYILGVIPTLAPSVLPLFVHKFTQDYPRVELRIFEYQTDDLIRHLKEGKVDAGICATPLEDQEIMEEHLFYEPFKVFFSPNHPLLKKKTVDESELDLRQAWLLKEGHCLRTQALQLCQLKKNKGDSRLFFEAGSLETVVNMVKGSNGFTVLPFLTCMNLSSSDQRLLRDFKNHLPVRDISFVTGPMSIKQAINGAMIKIIRNNLPQDLKKSPDRKEILGIL
jgi:LysR family transcriptional regulator, hydrogen peroxide-inducible genes activator